MIELKTKKEIKIMREGGKRLRNVLDKMVKFAKPGISELGLEKIANEEIEKLGGKPSFKMVPRYRWASCLTVNDEVVHGIPKERKLKEGDILGIDLGMYYQGLCTDLATTIGIGKVSQETSWFLKTGQETLDMAITLVKKGNFIGDISLTIEEGIKKEGFSPVEALTGHGVGHRVHEDPAIPCVLEKNHRKTPKIQTGMTLAIEVIYNQGGPDLVLEDDGWTISTQDGKISGLFEETVAVLESGPLVLTR
ncbi:MAG: type I methionyl aminopeptidase [bacterium]|nr:type I methionyl aminopeptidase [bacterium]